jgi:hypothetical protein
LLKIVCIQVTPPQVTQKKKNAENSQNSQEKQQSTIWEIAGS